MASSSRAKQPIGKAEDVALREATNVLNARIANWKLDKANVQKWGENNLTNYGNYLKYLQNQGLISEPVSVEDVVTNQWIERINNFDPQRIEDQARAWK